ncbi:sugar-transfer associated ATP-grasp domain-containing protein [Halorientalis salina]|uniref:sugar-transfer associated ATP-grasp domain-containing protein n=1 Tax=Halorientalis salina TaxID=2932266 RepID=UPI002022A871|nr:sugar-transfer associated ATP-grasp domain-containing protein [Halorientalis salina]
MWLWRRGFLSRSDAIYDLDDGHHRAYLTDFERFVRTPLINGEWNVTLTNKLIFHWMMERFDAQQTTVYGMVRNDRYLPIDTDQGPQRQVMAAVGADGLTGSDTTESMLAPEGRRSNGGTPEQNGDAPAKSQPGAPRQVRERLDADGRLVLKWIKGGGGNNVYICSTIDGGYRVNDERLTGEEFETLVEGLQEYLVCEFVDQSPFFSAVYPDTTNTLRIITMFDETAGAAFIPIAILRAGTDRSVPVDNFSEGGLSAEVDIETGKLGTALQLRNQTDLVEHDEHPLTGTQLAGVTIPAWTEIREKILAIAEANQQLPYVGWDVVPTDDEGSFKIIEGNRYPGMRSLQSHRPLLADERVRSFYERHDVLDR